MNPRFARNDVTDIVRRRVPIDLILNEILIEETFKENISERKKKEKKKIMIQGRGLHFASDLHFGTGVINTL